MACKNFDVKKNPIIFETAVICAYAGFNAFTWLANCSCIFIFLD
jgi:hypothetical protein